MDYLFLAIGNNDNKSQKCTYIFFRTGSKNNSSESLISQDNNWKMYE